jgi:dTDP-4-dehydrorhamnose reductase
MGLYDSILITGGGGMLGHALADLLGARGSVKAMSRAELDVTDDAALERVFTECELTLVLNCAAHTKVDLCEQEEAKATAINGRAVGKMAELCAQHGAFLVQVSTDFVFDGMGKRAYRVEDAVCPLSVYGKSKLLGETELQRSELRDWLIVRTAWVYGRHGVNFPRTMVTAARAGKPLSVIDDQIGSPTYAPDLAEGITALLDSQSRGVWHFTNSGQTSWRGFAAAALAEFGVQRDVAPLSSEQWRQMRPTSAPRPAYSVLDTAKFTQATGRRPRAWEEALRDFRAAVEKNGWE